MIPTIRPSHFLAAGTVAIATSMAAPASADITGAYVVTYSVTAADFDGRDVTVTVQDLYLASDDAGDTVLNIYNCNIAESAMVNYFQSFTGTGWQPTNLGGPFDAAALRLADSFVTIGGFAQDTIIPEQAPGAGAGSGLDPNFGGNNAAMPGTDAGWYNGSPPSLNGFVGNVADGFGGFGLGVLVGRFAYAGDFDLSGSTLEVTWNQGPGTPGQQEGFTVINNGIVDCNKNGIPDSQEVDCNNNGIPDECDLDEGNALDCNNNGIPDDCDLSDATSPDCNADGIPDECQSDGNDCNQNGIDDLCDISDGSSLDCNQNGVPDECDLGDLSFDYNQNGVIDTCEALTIPGDYASIADAVANAPEGSVVLVDPGTYDQPVTMDRGIAIVAAEGPELTRLDGAKRLGPVVLADDAPEGAILAGFTIRAGDPSALHPLGGGVVGIDSNLTIADCVIVGNIGMDGGGLRFEGGAPTIVGCEIRTNLSYEAGGGLRLVGSDATVEDCLLDGNVVLDDVFGWAIAASGGQPDFADVEVAFHNNQPVVFEELTDLPGGTMTATGLFIHDNLGLGLALLTSNPEFCSLADSRICGNAGIPVDGIYTDLGDNILLADRCPDVVVPDDASTIQLAIDAALDGERIAVRPGTYEEGGLSLAGRDLELVGVDDLFLGKPSITGPIDASFMPATSLLRDLAITGGTGLASVPGYEGLTVGGGLVLDESSLLVEECDLLLNQADLGGGIFVRGGAATLRSLYIDQNSSGSSGGGLHVEGDASTTLTLEGCLVVDNVIPLLASSRGGGIDARGLTEASSLRLENGAISQNVRENLAQNLASGSFTDLGGNSIPLANDCDGNGLEDAADIGDFARPDCNGNLVPDDCDIEGGDEGDCDEDGIPDACQIADGSADLNLNGIIDDCEAELVFAVPTTFPTIAAAFAAAPDGTVIGLAPGSYDEPIDFADRDLVLRGDLDDPSLVVIDGSAATASVIAFTGNQTSDAGLEGMTITGGDFGTPIPGQPTSLAGGGLFVFEASPRFIAVIFRDNVSGFGGGAYVLGGASSFTDCVFIDNVATTDGGGLMLFDTLATFDGARIENNQATNDGGGVKVVRGDSIFAGGEVTGNQATEGGGIYYFADAETDRLQLQGMTITGNLATKSGGGLKARFGNPGFEILDSVVCDNEPDSIDGPYLDLGGNDLCVCPADLNGDGVVGAADLGILLGAWGPCTTDECLGDLNRDGDVDAADLGPLLGSYGACP